MATQKEFTDINNLEVQEKPIAKKQKGFFVTRTKTIALSLGAILVCTIVGVVVYYARPSNSKEGTGDQSGPAVDGGQNGDVTVLPTLPPAPAEVRLPTNLRPVHYDVRLRPDIYGGDPTQFRFTGTVDASLEVVRSTKEIHLHIKALTINTSTLTVRYSNAGSGASLRVKETREYASSELLIISMETALQTGRRVRIHIEFSRRLRKDLYGIYYSDYVDEHNNTVYLVTSQLQATDARKVFPCMDEPALKASFRVTVERRGSHNSKSNMPIEQTTDLGGGWYADRFEQTPVMSTYLLAFLVSDFRCTERRTNTGVLVEICARPTAFDQMEFANSIAVEMQEWFEWFHNISYPLPKMTHAAVPDFSAGAMENWGLVFYRETALLYDAATASAANKQRVAVVVSHELAHMWFGDLVTPHWWDDIWLNEGFASFMELQGIHHIHDFHTWQMEQQFLVEDLQDVLVQDSLTSSHPIYQPVYHPNEISAIFDGITYSKGSSVIRMMKYFLGEDTFRFGLSDYLKEHMYSATDHVALFDCLTRQASRDGKSIDVTSIMNTWIRQMGYPVVTLSYSADSGIISVQQKHFLLNPTQEITVSSPYNYNWKVPVTYVFGENSTTNVDEEREIYWLNEESGNITTTANETGWLLGNIGLHYFYRVNYDPQNWDLLIRQLRHNHELIHLPNRVQIVDDLFNLGKAGEISQVLAMSATQYMYNEDEYTPWYSTAANMKYIRLMLSKGQGSSYLNTYMQELARPLVSQLGFVDRPTDAHLDLRKRALLLGLACQYQQPMCLLQASSSFRDWVRSNYTQISVNFAGVTHCYGIAEGGDTEWMQAYNRLLTSNSGAERNNLLLALGCSKKTWILQRYLQWALAEDEYGIAQQDFSRAISAVSRNSIGTHLAWSFFKANWDLICERFCSGTFTLSSIINSLTETFSTEWELEDLRNFVAQHPNQGSAKRQFQQSIENTIINIRWRNRNEANLLRWLQMVNA